MKKNMKSLINRLIAKESAGNLFVLNDKRTRQVISFGTCAGGFFYPVWSIIYASILGTENIYDPITWRIVFSLPLLVSFLLNFNRKISPIIQTYLVALGLLTVQGHLLYLTLANDFRLEYQMGLMTIIGVCAQFFMSYSSFALYYLTSIFSIILCAVIRQDLSDAILFAASITVITMGGISLFFRISITRALADSKDDMEQKNQEVQAILDGIESGILAIYEKNGKLIIESSLSKSYTDIIEDDRVRVDPGSTLDEAFLNFTDFNLEEKSIIETVVSSSIGESLLSWECNSHLLPSATVVGEKHLALNWYPIEDKNENLIQVLLVVRDDTSRIEAEKEIQGRKETADRLFLITSLSNEKFKRFYSYIRDVIKETSSEKLTHEPGLILRALHTLKGNARTNGFNDISTLVHEIEDHIIHNSSDHNFHTVLKEHLAQLEYKNELYYQDWTTISGFQEDSDKLISVNRNHLTEIFRNLSQLQDSYQQKPYEDAHYGFCEILFGNIVSQLESNIHPLDQVAKRMDKKLPRLLINPSSLAIKNEYIQCLDDIFVHLFRNSVDHGIESISERLKKRKPEQGTINIEVEDDQEFYIMHYRDDGKGLNVKKILGLSSMPNQLNHEQAQKVQHMIFSIGTSTAESVTEISGRGIGMNAVKSFIKSLGGDISLVIGNEKDAGFFEFNFQIKLPRKIFVNYSDVHQTSELLAS